MKFNGTIIGFKRNLSDSSCNAMDATPVVFEHQFVGNSTLEIEAVQFRAKIIFCTQCVILPEL